MMGIKFVQSPMSFDNNDVYANTPLLLDRKNEILN
jgi:hypothetical protein